MFMFVSFGFALATAFEWLEMPYNRARSLIVNESITSFASFSNVLPTVDIVFL